MTHGASDPTTYTAPGHYLMFSADATEEQARLVFVKRYGMEPERVFGMYGAGREVWVGPVPEGDKQWTTQTPK